MFFPSPSTWKMVQNTPNHVPMNTIGLDKTSREILKDVDVPLLPVVLITPDSIQLTVILMLSHNPHSPRRLIQYVYDRKFSSSVQQKILICFEIYGT